MRNTPALVASTDRTMPTVYEGRVEPNWWCRGWNAKRLKYCKTRAGAGTSHPGIGRCRHHGGLRKGGDPRVRSGRHSRTRRTTLGELIDAELRRPDPLNLAGELATLRALVVDLRTRTSAPPAATENGNGAANGNGAPHAEYVPDRASEIVLAESIGRMVERIERIRSQNAISRPELNRILHQVWASIDARVRDVGVKADIRDDILRIAL